ncbi:MAG: DUF1311 domain-containing protein [Sphingomonadales bacterium]|nr:DUF1311 domain-containing protein [Sphingomonadales bacterium]
MRLTLIPLFVALPVAAFAQDLPADALTGLEDSVRACFADYDPIADGPSCLGQAAQGCMGATDESTMSIVACIGAETQVWDDLLNSEYKARRAELTPRGLNDQLLDAQRAWLAFRDAECALEVDRWGDGSMAVIVGANCMMEMTATRAAQLRDKKADP